MSITPQKIHLDDVSVNMTYDGNFIDIQVGASMIRVTPLQASFLRTALRIIGVKDGDPRL